MSKSETLPAPMSSESIGFLVEVKKGKPRKFAMICKGSTIVSLVIYKKGNVEKRKKEAKESGKGQFYFGVVDGKGVDIRFVLARADGFEREPVKTAIMKSFLADAADMKLKPRFELIDEAPVVLDEDDPLVVRFRGLQPKALAACNNFPERASEINTLCQLIESLFGQDQLDEAATQLDALELLLRTLPGGSESPQTPIPGDGPSKSKLQEAFDKLVPKLKQVVNAFPDRKAEFLTPVAQIKKQLEQDDLVNARQGIIEVSKLLKMAMSPGESNDQDLLTAASLSKRMAELEPLLLKAKRALPNEAGRFQGVWDFASKQMESGNLAKAREALARLEPKLREAIQNAPTEDRDRFGIEEGVVETTRAKLTEVFSKSKLVWGRTRGSLQSELAKLAQAIVAASQQEEDFVAIKANVDNVYSVLDFLDEELIDVLGEAATCDDVQKQDGLHREARQLVQNYLDFVQANPFLSEVDENPFVPIKVRSSLDLSLRTLDKALQQRVLA